MVDTSQAALPGATVTVQNQETNEVATATTNSEGTYTIPVPPARRLHADGGDERVPEEHAQRTCGSQVGETANINVQLGVGG